jgi:hypothetical protein
VFSLRRAPRANPAKSKWVVTGSWFWTTMIAKIEATMIFKLLILLYLKAIGNSTKRVLERL